MDSGRLTRRSLLGAALVAVAVPRNLTRRGDPDRTRAYEALVDALVDHGALPHGGGKTNAGERLAALYAEALPRRRREIDAVLDGLVQARFARRPRSDRIALLRRWANEGGQRRVLAARALALAGATSGPADRALPVAI
jgi:hypothetical protein